MKNLLIGIKALTNTHRQARGFPRHRFYDWYVEFAIRQKEKEFREQHIVPMSEAYALLKEDKKYNEK